MNSPWKADIDRLAELITRSFEAAEVRQAERHQQLERRIEGLEVRLRDVEVRMQTLEGRFDQFGAATNDRFTSLEEQIRTLILRMDQFETRVLEELAKFRREQQELKHELARFSERVDALAEQVNGLSNRVERVEVGLLEVNVRLDGLSTDMRQRFRVVNDRLAQLAA